MIYAIEDPTPIERWGKDHWSTFAYLETRIVDHKGYLHNPHMRADGERYGTRLKDPDEERTGHNDWDCLADAYALGLIVLTPGGAHRYERGPWKLVNGRFLQRTNMDRSITFGLTREGLRISQQLRKHKIEGGNFKSFQPDLEALKSEAICDTCGVNCGWHAIDESCSNNDGGKIIRHPLIDGIPSARN